jgi:hypothetical protein
MNDVRNHLREVFPGRRMISLAMAMAMAWAVGLSSPSLVEAVEIKVPSAIPTIQQAIDAAFAGDTIRVAPGTYFENINFHGKAITVESEQGPEVTIIDGNGTDSVATFQSGETRTSVLRGFTLQNGLASLTYPTLAEGGGISIFTASPTITNNVITNNRACSGLGIAIYAGAPVVQGNIITRNIHFGCSGGVGGGIKIAGDAGVEILDNEISDHFMDGGFGGGIWLSESRNPILRGSVIISGNIIRGNIATGLDPCAQGGGLWIGGDSNALIVQNLITGNHAGCGGGIYWFAPGNPGPLVVSNTIADNDGAKGSGIFAVGFGSRTTLFTNNLIIGKTGQTAIYCEPFGDLNPSVFRFNNIFSSQGVAYGGLCTDQTGLNGNISADPLFVDPLHGDYHLQAGSPSVDAGDNAAPSLPETDFDGNPRICDRDQNGEGIVEMGAYELCLIQTLGPANVWLGVKNSDDAGLRVDVLAEVFLRVGATETKIGQGRLDNKPSGSSGFANAILNSMTLGLVRSAVPADGELEFKLSVRRTCASAGHLSGTVRLWYNGQSVDTGAGRDAGSRFAINIGSRTTNDFLRESFKLSPTAGSSRLFIDRFVDSSAACPGRPFTPFGTWTLELL